MKYRNTKAGCLLVRANAGKLEWGVKKYKGHYEGFYHTNYKQIYAGVCRQHFG